MHGVRRVNILWSQSHMMGEGEGLGGGLNFRAAKCLPKTTFSLWNWLYKKVIIPRNLEYCDILRISCRIVLSSFITTACVIRILWVVIDSNSKCSKSLVNVTKYAVYCGFGHTYWRNP